MIFVPTSLNVKVWRTGTWARVAGGPSRTDREGAIGTDEVTFDPEGTPDLEAWSEADVEFALLSRLSEGGGGEMLVFRSLDPRNR
jgi:hypothetical protein